MNEDSWVIIHVDKNGNGFLRAPNLWQSFKEVKKFTYRTFMGLHHLYTTIIAEDLENMPTELRNALISLATSKEAIIYDMATGTRI